MAAFAADDPFDAQPFGFRIDFGVQPLDHFMGGEEAEISPFGGIGAEGVVQTDFMENQQVTQESVVVGGGEIVGGRDDKQDIRPFFVDGSLHADAGNFLKVVHGEFDAVLESVGLDSKMIARAETIGHGLDDPVDIAADQVQQLPADHGDFGRVDAVGAKYRAAAAFSALVEIVKPLLKDRFVEIARTRQPPELSGCSEVPAINGAKKLRTQNGHVLGICGADIEMALVGTSSTADADVHEEAEGPVLSEPLLHSVEDDLFPVGREFPVFVERLPVSGIGGVEIA